VILYLYNEECVSLNPTVTYPPPPPKTRPHPPLQHRINQYPCNVPMSHIFPPSVPPPPLPASKKPAKESSNPLRYTHAIVSERYSRLCRTSQKRPTFFFTDCFFHSAIFPNSSSA
jgi:hypothetical protein